MKISHRLSLTLVYSCFLAGIAHAQSNYESYGFTTLTGSPFSSPGSADGTGSAARFSNPSGVAVDAGKNVYVADTANHTIRKIAPGAVVTTLAGLAGNPGSSDGAANAARFESPSGLAVDSAGNLYVADTGNQTIRKITSSGTVTTLAGSAGSAGNTDGSGSAAQFNRPVAVALDTSGNIYVADEGNNLIRKITADGVVTTLAAIGDARSIAVDANGCVYASGTDYSYNYHGNLIYYIYKIAPDGEVSIFSGFNASRNDPGIDGPPDEATFLYPSGLTINTAGELFVSDSDSIRKISSTGVVTTIAGVVAQFTTYCDAWGYFPGAGSTDGTATQARFSGPQGVAVGTGNSLYIADTGNNTVRKLSPTAVVTTLAGLAPGAGFADGATNVARFAAPDGIALDSAHNLYVADTGNDLIRKISKSGVVSTFAGSPGHYLDCHGFDGNVVYPAGVAIGQSDNVYASSHNAILLAGQNGSLGVFAGGEGKNNGHADGAYARFWRPHGLATDSVGNVYVADTRNDLIRKITPDGITSTIAGKALLAGSADGTGSAARFNLPSGVAVDQYGTVYVADTGNGTIRKITTSGVVSTLAGLAGSFGSSDGVGSAARFNSPYGIAVDSTGYVFVTDQGNNTIRRVSPDGVATTLGGIAGIVGSSDGFGANAAFSNPSGIAVDSSGVIYVTDTGNNTIRIGRRGRMEVEALSVKSKTPRPAGVSPLQWYGIFTDSRASGGAGVYFNANAVGNYIRYTVPVAQPGLYRIRVGIQTKPDKGIFQLTINGLNQGRPQDDYAPNVAYQLRDLGQVSLNAGSQLFQFTVIGKNPSSTGYTLAFDYIQLVPAQ